VKLLFFDDFKLGVLKGDAVFDVSSLVESVPHTGPHDLISGLIAGSADTARGSRGGTKSGGRASEPGAIRPPLPPAHEYRVHGGGNYMETAPARSPLPSMPSTSHRAPSSATADTMVLPDVPATIFEGEARWPRHGQARLARQGGGGP